MELTIPVFTAIRWMVFEYDKPFRGFATKSEAENFASNDSVYTVQHIPTKVKRYVVEDAPF
jgi:hypothetical protein